MEEATIDQSLNTKNVFSALRFAMSIDTLKNSPELVHELKISAQEQVEFMLSEDEEMFIGDTATDARESENDTIERVEIQKAKGGLDE